MSRVGGSKWRAKTVFVSGYAMIRGWINRKKLWRWTRREDVIKSVDGTVNLGEI